MEGKEKKGFATTNHLHEIERGVREDVLYLAKKFGMDETRLLVNVQQLRSGYGRYAPKAWTVNGSERDELCINPNEFCILKSPQECIDTLLHELTHVYCNRNGITETSRNGAYHNKRFREVAESVFKLKCTNKGINRKGVLAPLSCGWTTTSVGNEEYLGKLNEELPYPFDGSWFRKQQKKDKAEGTRHSVNSYRFCCPKCGQTIRGNTKKVRVLCLDCRVPFKWMPKEGTKEAEVKRREEEEGGTGA